VIDQNIAPGIAIDDGVGVHFLGTVPHQVITPREKASAYRVRVMNGAVQEEPLVVEPDRLHA
jgi:hypothetical protein